MRIFLKGTALIVSLLFLIEIIHGQNNFNISGVIKDSVTDHSIEYVNIGIFNEGIGTVSGNSGKFLLSVPENRKDDSIMFSRIGYTLKKIKIADLVYANPATIYLKPKTIQLEEVSINAKKLKTRIKGNKSQSKKIVLGISSALALGKETGTLIRLPNKEVWIKDFNFHIVYNRPDSALFRLNMYKYDGGIKENILNENIYFVLHNNQTGDFKVDLSKYGIVIKDDVFVSVEILKLYSKGPDPRKKHDKYYYDRINISGTITGSKSFGREISLGKWERLEMNFSPGFWLTVAY